MSIDTSKGGSAPLDPDACYEVLASQEEIYLEEKEEELRTILIFEEFSAKDEGGGTAMSEPDDKTCESVDKQLEQAAEELIDGDADDVPLSQETIASMLKRK